MVVGTARRGAIDGCSFANMLVVTVLLAGIVKQLLLWAGILTVLLAGVCFGFQLNKMCVLHGVTTLLLGSWLPVQM